MWDEYGNYHMTIGEKIVYGILLLLFFGLPIGLIVWILTRFPLR
jgi:hypothetical protein